MTDIHIHINVISTLLQHSDNRQKIYLFLLIPGSTHTSSSNPLQSMTRPLFLINFVQVSYNYPLFGPFVHKLMVQKTHGGTSRTRVH